MMTGALQQKEMVRNITALGQRLVAKCVFSFQENFKNAQVLCLRKVTYESPMNIKLLMTVLFMVML